MRQTLAIGSGTPPAQAKGLGGDVQSLVMAGSSASDATPITSPKALITTSSAGGAILFAPTPGDSVMIKNEGGATCTLYPHSGGTINGTSSLTMATAKSVVVFASSATAWHSIPTVAS
jgi:hypothetical protein